jgi:hypothetical protein
MSPLVENSDATFCNWSLLVEIVFSFRFIMDILSYVSTLYAWLKWGFNTELFPFHYVNICDFTKSGNNSDFQHLTYGLSLGEYFISLRKLSY